MSIENWRAPSVPEGEVVLYDEPGRVLQQDRWKVCYSAFHYRLSSRARWAAHVAGEAWRG